MTETKTTATQVGRDTTEKLRESMATSEFTKKAKDAAYTIVGLGVMGAQKATVATKHAAKQFGVDDGANGIDLDALKSKAKDASAAARRQLSKADGVVEGALSRIEEALAPIEDRLPGAAKDTVNKVRDAGKELHAQVKTKVSGEITAPPSEPKKKASTTEG